MRAADAPDCESSEKIDLFGSSSSGKEPAVGEVAFGNSSQFSFSYVTCNRLEIIRQEAARKKYLSQLRSTGHCREARRRLDYQNRVLKTVQLGQ